MRSGLLAILAMGLAACGGGGGGDNAFIGDGSSGSGGSTAGDGTVGETVVRLGSGYSPFSESVIEVEQGSISAGGSTVLRARVVEEDGTPFIQSALTVSFSSPCTAQNLGKFSETAGGAAANSFEFNSEGAVNIVYTDQGCSASGSTVTNNITAKVTVDSGELIATGSVVIQPGQAGGILLISPLQPVELALNGASATDSRPQNVAVDFRVVDGSGSQAPVEGQRVCFTLNTTAGGLSLSDDQVVTGSDGVARTVVTSGNVSTPVVVTASVAGDASSSCAALPANARVTQNDNIIVSTGLPDQDGFTLSVDKANIEGFDRDDAEINVTVALNDLFNNPVRDGLVVFFTAEGGTIGDQCSTVNGRCSVTWTSTQDKPFDGRVTITAYTIGEESFIDANGNGLYDVGEDFGDRSEPFVDANESDARDIGQKCSSSDSPGDPECIEEFADFNQSASFDGPNGSYNGTRCASPCAAGNSLYVWRDVQVVMSRSAASVRVTSPAGSPIQIPDEGQVDVAFDVYSLMPDGSEQPMPVGTTISVTADTGQLVGTSSFSVINTNSAGPTSYIVTIKDSGDPEGGKLRVVVNTPSGVETTRLFDLQQN